MGRGALGLQVGVMAAGRLGSGPQVARSLGGLGVVSLALGVSLSPRALGGLSGLLCGGGVMFASKGDGLLLPGVPVPIDGHLCRGADVPAGQVASALVGGVEAVNIAIGTDRQASDASGGQ